MVIGDRPTPQRKKGIGRDPGLIAEVGKISQYVAFTLQGTLSMVTCATGPLRTPCGFGYGEEHLPTI